MNRTIELIGARDARPPAREAAQARLARWFADHSKIRAAPLHAPAARALDGDALKGAARGAAFQLLETGAAFDRRAATAHAAGAALTPTIAPR